MRIALVDSISLGRVLGVSPATIRSWARRHPDRLPRLGRDQQGRTLYSYRDAVELRDDIESARLARRKPPCNTSGEVGALCPTSEHVSAPAARQRPGAGPPLGGEHGEA